MARTHGIIQLSGRIGDITFFHRNGKTFARKSTSLNAHRINTDPAFARTRESNNEFRCAAQRTREIYHTLSPLIQPWRGPQLFARLTAAILPILKRGSGPPGRRDLSFTAHGPCLHSFSFNPREKITSRLLHLPSVLWNPGAETASLSWSRWNAVQRLHPPLAATHVTLGLHLLSLSDFAYEEQIEDWRPLHSGTHLRFASSGTAALPLHTSDAAAFPPELRCPWLPSPPAQLATFALLSLQFSQSVNHELFPLVEGGHLEIISHA